MKDERILEMNEVVSVWEIYIKDLDPVLKIKILKINSGKFIGISNLKINNYQSMRSKDTPYEAMEDALYGFLLQWQQGESKIEEDHDW